MLQHYILRSPVLSDMYALQSHQVYDQLVKTYQTNLSWGGAIQMDFADAIPIATELKI